MELLFDMSEYYNRLKKVKDSMEEHGLDVLLVSNPSNINYLSGYDAYSFYVVQALIVIKDQDQPYWIGRRQDANGAKLTTWLEDDHIYYYTDDYLHSTTKHPMDVIAHVLKQLRQDRRRIGLEMGSYYFSAIAYETLKGWLPDATFVNTTNLVSYVRMIKSARELQYMRHAARNAELAMQTGVDSIKTGVSENEVVANIYQAQMKGAGGIDGDYPSIVPLLLSGVKTSSPHLTWDGATFQGNEIITLELAGVHKRYHSPLARTIKLGKPSDRERRLSDALHDAMDAALSAVKPGEMCGDIAMAWTEAIKKYGFDKYDRLGYSVGLSYPPNWSEHTASIRQNNQTVLQPNMVFHLIPGLWEEDCGLEFSETFVVTEDGCETLADYPRELIVKEDVKGAPSQR
ncbi:ectoine hydrolase DoeA [Lentibacillus kapialis]|uniref:Ectoine hydrolase DoeA n=1 Tax=Lentibacillus kapialis TaxID=340214 RepID=A0A917PXY2_9BACI|nr:Xaa-Pro peptidase family protein [Lentibacillus kapialis]GGJ99932.1 ectoine hydrolase DoeA [Lentibacillus kapialis]